MAGLLDFLSLSGGGGSGLLGNLGGFMQSPEMNRLNLAFMAASGNETAGKMLAEEPQRQSRIAAIRGMLPEIDKDPNIHPAIKIAIRQDPALGLKLLENLSQPNKQEGFSLGEYYGSRDPRTGEVRIQGAVPSWRESEPGRVGGYAMPPALGGMQGPVQPPMPSAAERARPVPGSLYQGSMPGQGPAPGSFQPVLEGGPEKPPAGYKWNDPADPSKGLTAIPGGPATQLPAETAGRKAMIDAARPAVEEAKKYFLDPKTPLAGKSVGGVFSPAIQAVGQRTGSFEIGRQQRNIQYAVEAALRTATGAAAPDSEVKRYADFYTPSLYDTLATRQQKLEALERFMDHASRNIGMGRLPDPSSFMSGSPSAPKASQDRMQQSVVPPEMQARNQQEQLRAAPDGSVISVQGRRFQKQGGQWVPMQ